MNSRRHSRFARLAGLALLLAICAGGAAGADKALIEFRIEDQFRREHTDAEFRDRALYLLVSDRQGSRHNDTWAGAIREAMAENRVDTGAVLAEVADLRGVPFFVKRSVRRKFPQDEDQWVLLDWKGVFARAYACEQDKLNILVFDAAGRLQHRVAVTELDAAVLARIVPGAGR